MAFNMRERDTSYCFLMFNNISKRFMMYPCLSSLLESRLALRIKHSYHEEHTPEYRISCEVDHLYRSTVVNLVKKQKCCSLSFLWPPVQQDTTDLDNFHCLGCLWILYHRCTCTLNWTEMPNVSFLTESRDCMDSTSYEYRKMLDGRGV